jgi:adenylosuccinate synthase
MLVSADLVFGLQWGDEGKGKAVDYISPNYDVIARFNGGDNAGHTVVHQGQTYKFHQIPSGVLNGCLGIIGSGVVLNTESLEQELTQLNGTPKLIISKRAHLILPSYKLLDQHLESLKNGKVGTTGRGIGPAYGFKALRFGIRVGDLFEEDLLTKLNDAKKLVENLGVEWQEPDIEHWRSILEPFVGDDYRTLHECLLEGKHILFEAAQGVLLDLDFGTYPVVTSSPTFTDGIHVGSGFNGKDLDDIIGVTKAYTTRVGNGAFPSELDGEMADFIRKQGAEFGTTTGRPRRVGWLDLVALKYACKISGCNKIFLTKLDVLSGLSDVGLVTAYESNGKRYDEWFDFDETALKQVRPVVEWVSGWDSPTHDGSPDKNLISFMDKIENTVRSKIQWISFGPGDEETMRMI